MSMKEKKITVRSLLLFPYFAASLNQNYLHLELFEK